MATEKRTPPRSAQTLKKKLKREVESYANRWNIIHSKLAIKNQGTLQGSGRDTADDVQKGKGLESEGIHDRVRLPKSRL